MQKEFRSHINSVKKFLNENADFYSKDSEMFAASISVMIGGKILKQGFDRVNQKRESNYFINDYRNGVNTGIITQVHFKGDFIEVFFKLQLHNRLVTDAEKERINNEYSKLFADIMSDIQSKIDSGEFSHLKGDLKVDYHIDKL
jgi:hypothetical protein